MFSLHLDQRATYTLMALLPLLLQVGALAFAIWADAYFKPKQKRVFLLLLTLVLLLIAQNYPDTLFYKWETGDLSRTLTGMLGYLLRPIILLLLYYLVEPEGRFWQGWTLVGVNSALSLTPLFSRLVFYIDGNSYHGGPLSKTCLIVSTALGGAGFSVRPKGPADPGQGDLDPHRARSHHPALHLAGLQRGLL